jgi:hypothetical protein
MKNVLISLLALAAISGAALANDRVDLRDSDTYFGKYATKHQSQATDSNAFAVANDGAALTAFARMQKISEANEHGSK